MKLVIVIELFIIFMFVRKRIKIIEIIKRDIGVNVIYERLSVTLIKVGTYMNKLYLYEIGDLLWILGVYCLKKTNYSREYLEDNPSLLNAIIEYDKRMES